MKPTGLGSILITIIITILATILTITLGKTNMVN